MANHPILAEIPIMVSVLLRKAFEAGNRRRTASTTGVKVVHGR